MNKKFDTVKSTIYPGPVWIAPLPEPVIILCAEVGVCLLMDEQKHRRMDGRTDGRLILSSKFVCVFTWGCYSGVGWVSGCGLTGVTLSFRDFRCRPAERDNIINLEVSPEIWMAIANMERLMVKDKIRLGDKLLSEINPKKCKNQESPNKCI